VPRIIRYFPLSHDVNADPVIWEMTGRFGDRTLRLYLELESISDRNGGKLPDASEACLRSLASKCQITRTTAARVWEFLVDKALISCDVPPRWGKYRDFHHTRKNKKTQTGKNDVPSEPDRTNQDRTNQKKIPPSEALEIAQLLASSIASNIPGATRATEGQMQAWARTADLMNRRDGHGWDEIRELLVWSQAHEFWRTNILSIDKFRHHWTRLAAQRAAEQAKQNGQANDIGAAMAEVLDS